MIDELNTLIEIKPPPEVIMQIKEPFAFNDVVFYPRWHENGFITYSGNLENLKLNIIHDKLSIKNSWHKYLLGNNYTDYHYSDIEETFCKLERKIKLNIEDAQIKKIAYGCVIRENPILNYPNWMYLKNTRPQPMMDKGKQYGCYFPFSDYKIKGYDKTFEVWKHEGKRLNDEFFRIEKEVRYMRHLTKRKTPINLVLTKDIFNKDILNQLADDLILNYRNIEKQINMNYSNLKISDLKILAVMQNNAIRDNLKNEHSKTYKNYKKRFKELSEGFNDSYFDEVEFKLSDKLTNLINS